jgi:DNA-binding LacI/PurR family transcriptional regulator
MIRCFTSYHEVIGMKRRIIAILLILPMLVVPAHAKTINWVDFDVAHSIRELLTPAVSRGYKHIGIIFFGHIENFNELLRKELLKVKRELKLPHEPYDDAVIYWQGSLDNILQQTVKFFQQKNRRFFRIKKWLYFPNTAKNQQCWGGFT